MSTSPQRPAMACLRLLDILMAVCNIAGGVQEIYSPNISDKCKTFSVRKVVVPSNKFCFSLNNYSTAASLKIRPCS